MPSAAPHPCTHTGCSILVPAGQARCPQHAPKKALGWSQDTHRIRGRRLQTLRAQLYAQEPVCRTCGQYLLLGTNQWPPHPLEMVRDHIIPLAWGGTDDPTNIQPLCRACSDAKTQQESRGGR